MSRMWVRALWEEDGQGMIEYALLLALIAVAAASAVAGFGVHLREVFDGLTHLLPV